MRDMGGRPSRQVGKQKIMVNAKLRLDELISLLGEEAVYFLLRILFSWNIRYNEMGARMCSLKKKGRKKERKKEREKTQSLGAR